MYFTYATSFVAFKPWMIKISLNYIERFSLYKAVNTLFVGYINQREIMASCPLSHTEYTDSLWAEHTIF
jgi:hypothetical protein